MSAIGCVIIVFGVISSEPMSRSAGPKLLRTYGKVLRGRRKGTGLTQEKLLDEVVPHGFEAPSRTTISSLENGHEEPKLGMIFKIGRALGVRPSAMLRDVEDEILSTSERQRMDRGSAKIETTPPNGKNKRRSKVPGTR